MAVVAVERAQWKSTDRRVHKRTRIPPSHGSVRHAAKEGRAARWDFDLVAFPSPPLLFGPPTNLFTPATANTFGGDGGIINQIKCHTAGVRAQHATLIRIYTLHARITPVSRSARDFPHRP